MISLSLSLGDLRRASTWKNENVNSPLGLHQGLNAWWYTPRQAREKWAFLWWGPAHAWRYHPRTEVRLSITRTSVFCVYCLGMVLFTSFYSNFAICVFCDFWENNTILRYLRKIDIISLIEYRYKKKGLKSANSWNPCSMYFDYILPCAVIIAWFLVRFQEGYIKQECIALFFIVRSP